MMNKININKKSSEDVNYDKFILFSLNNSSEKLLVKIKARRTAILFLKKPDLQQ